MYYLPCRGVFLFPWESEELFWRELFDSLSVDKSKVVYLFCKLLALSIDVRFAGNTYHRFLLCRFLHHTMDSGTAATAACRDNHAYIGFVANDLHKSLIVEQVTFTMSSEIAAGTRGGFSMNQKTRPAVNVIATPSVAEGTAPGSAEGSAVPAGGMPGAVPGSAADADDDSSSSSSS